MQSDAGVGSLAREQRSDRSASSSTAPIATSYALFSSEKVIPILRSRLTRELRRQLVPTQHRDDVRGERNPTHPGLRPRVARDPRGRAAVAVSPAIALGGAVRLAA